VQRNLLEFLKKRDTKQTKAQCCNPLANIAKNVDAVGWVRRFPVGDHVFGLVTKFFVGEQFRHEENRAEDGYDACQNEANREEERRTHAKLRQLVSERRLDPAIQGTAAK